MKRNRIWIIGAFAVVIGIVLLISHDILSSVVETATASASTSQNQSQSGVTGECTLSQSGYALTLTNNNATAVDVTGFTVLFDDANGNELASDTEPGTAIVNGVESIGMNDWIGSDNSLTWHVGETYPSGAFSCQIAVYNSPNGE